MVNLLGVFVKSQRMRQTYVINPYLKFPIIKSWFLKTLISLNQKRVISYNSTYLAGGHSGAVVKHSPPTSEIAVQIPV